jgi:CheY-like chemotaxis protein
MVGKITQYDPDKEAGEVEGEDGLSYPFSIIDISGFSSAPRVGQEVEFETDEGVIYSLKPCSLTPKEPKKDQPKKQVETIKEEITYEDISLPIPLEVSIKESIERYFSKMIVDLEEYSYDFKDDEQLDYIRMRRFLNTAYNNLLDLDSKFINNDLKIIHQYLDEIYKLYCNFVQKIDLPNISFETIFLSAQPQYMWRKQKLENNRSEIATQKGVVRNLSAQVENLKKEHLAKPRDKSVEIRFKHFNGMYVDALHHLANLRDENIVLLRELKAFEEEYYGPFVSEFGQFARKQKEKIVRLLDGYAYYFDKMMWDLAENSKSIREFFLKANIQDEFSSKTYLKYYLKGLDELKMSELHRELKTLLAYLESLSQVSVAIVDEDKQKRNRLLKIIRLYNPEVKVSAYEQFKLFASSFRQESYQLVLLDISVRNPSCEKAIETIRDIEKNRLKKCRICIMSKSFSKEELAYYHKMGISHFLIKAMSENDLAKRIKVLLEDLHEDQLRA